MTRRRVRVVVLCEDRQHAAFIRRFLERVGWTTPPPRVEICSAGAGDQWVRSRYPKELSQLRKEGSVLVVMTDADTLTIGERLKHLDKACRDQGIEPRRSDEPVAVLVPRRNIETWIAYLAGQTVDEEKTYARLARERDCAPHVKRLKDLCDRGSLESPAPPSLESACQEWKQCVQAAGP